MKRFFYAGCLAVGLAGPVLADPSAVYINNGSLITNAPPVVDATNFINNGTFEIGFNIITNVNSSLVGSIVFAQNIYPFDFSDVQFYTNRGVMACDTGFIFNNSPSSVGSPHRSTLFGNANVGQISSGSAFSAFSSTPVLFGGQGLSLATALPLLQVSSTNIVNAGVMSVGINGLLAMDGVDLKLARGTLHVEGFEDFVNSGAFTGTNLSAGALLSGAASFNIGIFDRYWGFGIQTNLLTTANVLLPIPSSPSSNVTNANFTPTSTSFSLFGALAFGFTNKLNDSNFVYQAVLVNTNVGFSTDVKFSGVSGNGFSTPVIQWVSVLTNFSTSTLVTNALYLEDFYGSTPTNYLVTNSFTISGVPQPSPYNFVFNRTFSGFSNLLPGNVSPYPGTMFGLSGFPSVTNVYAAYGVTISGSTAVPDPNLLNASITNVAGRIELSADGSLDLTRATVTGANYLRLNSTNHFVGTTNAQISASALDLNLGTTNGFLTISNLVAPYVPRMSGTVDAYAARWTNTVNGVTNTFHVLIVNAQLAPTSAVALVNFQVRSTNVVISDRLDVTQNFLINAQRLTITSNTPDSQVTSGSVTIESPNILWSPSFPTLQYFTNFGTVSVPNTTYFAGIRSSPYYLSNYTEPYQAFVNHGTITTAGNIIWANYMENTGNGSRTTNNGVVTVNSAVLSSSSGPITVQANTAVLANGSFSATPIGDLSITSGSLSVSNHGLQANGALSLTVTNALTDGGVTSSNFWTVSDGFNLFLKPGTGDLLGTTITSSAPSGLEVTTVWAGEDRGASAAGFSNDAAVGHLILNGGGNGSSFFFGGTNAGAHNAMYVDLLEFQGTATNQSVQGGQLVFSALDIDPSITIYFADAIMNGQDISEKLNGSSGGRAVWVPSYAGFFSGTNLTYPSGHVYTFNRGLVLSQDIDSDGDGTVNFYDPTPIFTPDNIGMTVTITNLPPLTARVTWHSLANSTNFLYYKTVLASTNWQLLTNFVQGPANGVVTISDPVQGSSRYYKVQVDAQQP